jgi:hypothetical protein
VNLRVLTLVGVCVIAAVIVVGTLLVFILSPPMGSGPKRTGEATPSSTVRPDVEPTPRSDSVESKRRASPAGSPETGPPAASPGAKESAAAVGTLRIQTDVPGASVFIDRQFLGVTPLTAENVQVGAHQLNVSAPGFEGIARTIDVEPGPRDLMIRLLDVRLNARLAVVHKHRFGSCTGQLVATTRGIRYETADKDDQFAAPLTELETFQIDYQDKNLRIKVRKGRQYNFTDPDGNADRLFAFHRDVDKARERLVASP